VPSDGGGEDGGQDWKPLPTWVDPTSGPRGPGRQGKHFGNLAERHRAAQASYTTRRKWKLTPEQRREERAKWADYMRDYRDRRPSYVNQDNRRRRLQRLGSRAQVPPGLKGLHLRPSTLRALTGKSVDYSRPELLRFMEENPEYAVQVLSRYAVGLILAAAGAWSGAGAAFKSLPGIGNRKPRGRKLSWLKEFAPIRPLDAESSEPDFERCAACKGRTLVEDMGGGEQYCLDCGTVVSNGGAALRSR
jgi:hypothetical protein